MVRGCGCSQAVVYLRRYSSMLYSPDGAAIPPSKGVVSIALFGLGRAGSIHLANLVANPRVMYSVLKREEVGSIICQLSFFRVYKVRLAYVVEADKEKCQGVKKMWNMEEGDGSRQTIFVQPDVRW